MRWSMLRAAIVDFLKDQRAIAGPVQRWRRRRREIHAAKTLDAYLATHAVRKLHLGCGTIILPGWFNSDFFLQSAGSVFLDVTKPFPIADRSFDYVYHEQLLEHVTYPQGSHMLRECRRILRPGGKIRIATPKLDVVLRLFGERSTPEQKRYIQLVIDSLPPEERIYNPCFVLNNLMRNYGHQFVYDEANISRVLAEAGFADLVFHRVGESDDPELRGIESHARVIGEEWNNFETMVIQGARDH